MPRPRTRRNPELSPLTLRRRYLPRPPNDRRPPAAHQSTQRAAAQPQVQHPQTPLRPERQTENATATNWTVKLTRFKPGFEQQTEMELARAFHRPPRTYKEDPPFYPWLPPEPYVNFFT